MRINNNGLYKREIDLNHFSSSLFLFGPRLTGKTHLLTRLKATAFYDLLDPELEMRFRVRPQEFWEVISLLKNGARVIVDEIQKDFRKTELIICSLRDKRSRQIGANIRVEPYTKVLKLYRSMAKKNASF